MAFKNVLKELRNDKRLSHKQLAEKIGYSKAIIGFWESGKYEPTATALIAIANFFGVSIDYLLGRENEDGSKNYNISNSFNNNSGSINFKG